MNPTCVILQSPVGASYIPTDEERRIFKECNKESFYYRCMYEFCSITVHIVIGLIGSFINIAVNRF